MKVAQADHRLRPGPASRHRISGARPNRLTGGVGEGRFMRSAREGFSPWISLAAGPTSQPQGEP